MIWINANGVKTGSGSWDYSICPYYLPDIYRPRKTIIVPTLTYNGASCTGAIKVEKITGEIVVQNMGYSGSDDIRHGVLMFPI